MIPPFNDHGYLPPGLHRATLNEIERRFGRESELRQAQMQSIRWLVDLARQAGALRLVINGSFVTDRFEPNDVDCVLLMSPEMPLDSDVEAELTTGLPFLEISLVLQEDFDLLVNRFFATDRESVPKGMIEIMETLG